MSWRDRLQCAGPRGSDRSDISPTSVTSVTTSTDALHSTFVVEQRDLDATILPKTSRLGEPDQQNEDDSIRAFREIGGMLALAYRRFSAIRQVPANQHDDQLQSGLALSGKSSVHGVCK